MGVFSKFGKKAKSLVFDKDPLGVIEKSRQPKSPEAYKKGVEDARRSQWTTTTATGTVPPVIKIASTAPKTVTTAPAPSRKVFSTPKSKTPRTFIRDLSDANLGKTFGTATTGTPRAKDTAKLAPSIKGGDSFSGPAPAPPSTAPPTPTSPKSPTETKVSGLPSMGAVTGEGIKKAGRYVAGAAVAAGAVVALASARKSEARKGERRGTERRVTTGTGPNELERRITETRRAVAGSDRRIQTGTEPVPASVIKGNIDKALAERAAARESFIEKTALGVQKEHTEAKKAQEAGEAARETKIQKTVAAIQEEHKPKVKMKVAGKLPATVSEPMSPVITGQRPIKTPTTAAPVQGPTTSTVPVAAPAKRKGRPKKTAAPPVTKIDTPVGEPPKPAEPKVSVGGAPKTASAAVAQGKPAPSIAELSESEKAAKVKANEAKIAQLQKEMEARKAAPKVPAEAKPKKTYRFRHPKKTPEVGGASSTLSVNEEIRKLTARETPSAGTITEERAIDKKRRVVRRRREMEKASARVGVSLSQAKIDENEARKRAIEEHIKKKGVIKLPAATEEMMMPERFAPPKSLFAEAAAVEAAAADPVLGTRKLKVPAQAQPTQAPISSRAALEAELKKAQEENTKLRKVRMKKEPKIRTEDMPAAKATAPPTVIRRQGLPPLKAETPTGIPPQPTPKAVEGVRLGTRKIGKAGALGAIAVGAGALAAGKEAKADSGSYTAAAKAAGQSLYESGRELAKFTMGATIASKLPGVLGTVGRFGVGRALPAVGVALAAHDIYQAGKEGVGIFRAKRAAEKERKTSQAKYGTTTAATATRHARERAKGLRK
jgi:hypothetical protein